ncbi:sigma factor-like helix-turn-helix DNA-binding protein [Trebonia sp.]|uniref:sigma factor-like helix-turn-helix DNA-binding protein n=1 Tax=Trebonia sp. TaxID=2767075 RepID=UPI00261B6D94|nr:sigma factor-like helix-turn-helix DNA-binding protein [Trebonia sp.]
MRRARAPGGDGSWAWLEPYPGPFTGPPAPSMSLAFIAALQRLPPQERAALVLSDVLGFCAAEVAEILGRDPDEAACLLARARAGIAGALPRPAPAPDEDAVAARFAGAFDRGDVPGIAALLTDDARLRLRPLPVEYQGKRAARHFLAAVAFPGGTTRYRLLVTRANGQPAFGCYLRDPCAGIDRACGLVVLTVAGDRIAAIDRFVDNSALPRFGLPRAVPSAPPGPAG